MRPRGCRSAFRKLFVSYNAVKRCDSKSFQTVRAERHAPNRIDMTFLHQCRWVAVFLDSILVGWLVDLSVCLSVRLCWSIWWRRRHNTRHVVATVGGIVSTLATIYQCRIQHSDVCNRDIWVDSVPPYGSVGRRFKSWRWHFSDANYLELFTHNYSGQLSQSSFRGR